MGKATIALPPRLECLRAYYTEDVVLAATARVILGAALPDTLSKGEKKAALLLVRELAPDDILSEAEECIHRGVSDKTLRGMKQRGELPVVCGGVNTVNS